jgi:pimeloyl-ACP methyl ester carboxylesterase
MKIEANGITIHYELTGSGPFLTLIHGAADNLNAWYKQAPAFSRHYTVLAYDIRGHGQSDIVDEGIAPDLWVLDLHALLEALRIDDTFLLGHSMGGGIALDFTLTYPEKAKALILSNSSPMLAGGARERPWVDRRLRNITEAVLSEGMHAVVRDRIEHMFTPGFRERDPDTVRTYESILLQNKPEGYLRVLKRIAGMVAQKPDLSRVQCPTLVIEGEQDPYGGEQAGETACNSLKNGRLKIFPTGHAPALEVPDDYNKVVLDFLGGISP